MARSKLYRVEATLADGQEVVFEVGAKDENVAEVKTVVHSVVHLGQDCVINSVEEVDYEPLPG